MALVLLRRVSRSLAHSPSSGQTPLFCNRPDWTFPTARFVVGRIDSCLLSRSFAQVASEIADTVSSEESTTNISGSDIQKKHLRPDYSKVIVRLVHKEQLTKAVKVYEEMTEANLKPTELAYLSLVTAYLNLHKPDHAFSLVREMKSLGLAPPERYLPLIWKSFLRISDEEDALSVLDMMLDTGMAPDAQKIDRAIGILEKSEQPGALDRMLRYFNHSRAAGLVLDSDSNSRVILRCLRDGDINLAFTIIQKFDTQPNPFDISNHVLEKFLQISSQYSHFEATAFLFQRAKKNNIPLEETTLNMILYSTARSRDSTLALQVWDYFAVSKIPPTNAAHHSMLQTLFSARKITEGFQFLSEAKKRGISIPYGVQKTLGMTLATDVITLDSSFYIMEDLHNQGVAIPVEGVNAIIFGCSQIGELDRAFATLAEIKKFHSSPNVESFNAILYGCLVKNRYLAALRFVEDMESAQVKPNEETYNILLSMAATQHQLVQMKQLMQEMKEKSFRLSHAMYRMVARKYARSGDIDAGKSILQEMARAGHHVSFSLKDYVESGAYRSVLTKSVNDILGTMGAKPRHRKQKQNARDASSDSSSGSDSDSDSDSSSDSDPFDSDSEESNKELNMQSK